MLPLVFKKEADHQVTRAIVINNRAAGSIGVFQKSDVYRKSASLVIGWVKNFGTRYHDGSREADLQSAFSSWILSAFRQNHSHPIWLHGKFWKKPVFHWKEFSRSVFSRMANCLIPVSTQKF
jgi:hypothetical protein